MQSHVWHIPQFPKLRMPWSRRVRAMHLGYETLGHCAWSALVQLQISAGQECIPRGCLCTMQLLSMTDAVQVMSSKHKAAVTSVTQQQRQSVT